MSRTRWFLVALLVLTALVGCQQAPTPTPIREYIVVTATPGPATPTPVPTDAPVAEGATLVLEGDSGSQTLTLEQLKALPATEGWGGIKSSTGKITPPALFKGVAIQALCEIVGSFDASWAANVVAKDGYAMTLSFDQVANGAFITYDPATGDEVTRQEKLEPVMNFGLSVVSSGHGQKKIPQ